MRRLGIILEVTFSIVKNTAVRRAKADIGVSDFVADVKKLSSTYTDTAASSGANSLKVWQAVKPWDETQVSPLDQLVMSGHYWICEGLWGRGWLFARHGKVPSIHPAVTVICDSFRSPEKFWG